MIARKQSTSLFFYKNYSLGTPIESEVWRQELSIPISFHSNSSAPPSRRIRLEKLTFTMCDEKQEPPYKHEKLARPLLLCSSLCEQQQYNNGSLPILALIAPLELSDGLLIQPSVAVGDGGISLPLGQHVSASFYFLDLASMEKVNFHRVLKDVCIHCSIYDV